MNLLRNYFKNPISTYADVGGVYYDSVLVEADYQPSEPRINVPESVEVTSVIAGGIDILDSMLITEVEQLEERLLIDAQDYKSYPHFNQAKRKIA